MTRDRPTLTGPETSVLVHAESRHSGDPWRSDRDTAERLVDRGLLRAAHIRGMDPNDIASVVYELTEAGRDAIAGHRG